MWFILISSNFASKTIQLIFTLIKPPNRSNRVFSFLELIKLGNTMETFLFFFFGDVKLITLIHIKPKTVHPGILAFQYSLVFPQPKHFGLTPLLQTELTCVQSYFLTEPHD